MENNNVEFKIGKLKTLNFIRQSGLFCVLRFAFCVRFHASRESGMTLMLSLIILSNIMITALAVGILSLNQLKISTSTKESGYAIFAGTTGLERAFYNTRIDPGICGAVVSPLEGSLYNEASYSVVINCMKAVELSVCSSGSAIVLTSDGQYGQSKTVRRVEGSWCN